MSGPAIQPTGRELIGREYHRYERRGALDTRAACLYCKERISEGREVHVEPRGLAHTVCWLKNAGKR